MATVSNRKPSLGTGFKTLQTQNQGTVFDSIPDEPPNVVGAVRVYNNKAQSRVK